MLAENRQFCGSLGGRVEWISSVTARAARDYSLAGRRRWLRRTKTWQKKSVCAYRPARWPIPARSDRFWTVLRKWLSSSLIYSFWRACLSSFFSFFSLPSLPIRANCCLPGTFFFFFRGGATFFVSLITFLLQRRKRIVYHSGLNHFWMIPRRYELRSSYIELISFMCSEMLSVGHVGKLQLQRANQSAEVCSTWLRTVGVQTCGGELSRASLRRAFAVTLKRSMVPWNCG